MSITLEQAKALKHGDIAHDDNYKNADGTCQRWRVTGKVKTWKRNPEKVKVPIARGLYQHGYLQGIDLGLMHLESECPRK